MRLMGFLLILNCLLGFSSLAQEKWEEQTWEGQLLRSDGIQLPMTFQTATQNGKPILYFINGKESIKVSNIKKKADSIFFEMPFFESSFRIKILANKTWKGVWVKEGLLKQQVMNFEAKRKEKMPSSNFLYHSNITGRWSIKFNSSRALDQEGIGEWIQKGNELSGTILTPTGDYRYLVGKIVGDSFQLSTFDGSHAFLFKARISKLTDTITGNFYSGASFVQNWTAHRNDTAKLSNVADLYLKHGQEKLNFKFQDLNKNWVSINDKKFKNKVVIIQILGSWCPNCMDETAFLSEFYRLNKNRGVEVLGLAYEYSLDFERSKKSIQKFVERFQVQYPILNTGVTVGDRLRTEKTLPQFTSIKSFPSTVILDRQGRVAKTHAGFEGPGTGDHFVAFKKEFNDLINQLLLK